MSRTFLGRSKSFSPISFAMKDSSPKQDSFPKAFAIALERITQTDGVSSDKYDIYCNGHISI